MDIASIVAAGPVMPVIVIDDASNGAALGAALLEGGIRTAEITLRTPAALDAIEAMATSCPDLIVGAGTVINSTQARQVYDAGGRFAVSPGATDQLIDGCAKVNLPLLPGAATVSEMMTLHEKGVSMMKFFPAVAAGGLAFLQALASPFPQFRFCPTGGITVATAPDWLALANVPCLGGSWVAPQKLIAERDFETITKNARAASSLG